MRGRERLARLSLGVRACLVLLLVPLAPLLGPVLRWRERRYQRRTR